MFSETRYYSRFKQIRNQFRKFQYVELIAACLEYLHEHEGSDIDYLHRHPWLVLLFAKWVLLDDNYPNAKAKKPSRKDVLKLLQTVFDMSSVLRMPTEYDHYSLWMRNIAYQQFPYQRSFGYRHLSRQMILFSSLPDNHLFKTEFKKLTGVSIQDFLELLWLLSFRFIDGKEKYLSEKWFDFVEDKYSREVIKKFLDAISTHIDEVQVQLRNDDDRRRRSAEHYEFTPFVKFPLLQITNGYLITERHILYRCIEHYVYDRLRLWDSSRFMDRFGEMFERYAEEAIKYANLAFTTESEIKEKLGEKGKQIDFIIHEDGSNIFIDTKGVEMNYKGRVTHSVSLLKDRTRDSVLKAITQAHDVICKLNQDSDSQIPSHECNYLLVVTYKDFYLGSGQNYYENIAKEPMDRVYKTYEGISVIPPENMYFITIDDLERACTMIRNNEVSLLDIMNEAKKSDLEPKSRKFDFAQHLESIGVEVDIPQYLKDEKEKIFRNLK